MMTFSITRFSMMTFSITPLGILRFSIMTLGIMTFSITPLGILRFSIMTICIKGKFMTISIHDCVREHSIHDMAYAQVLRSSNLGIFMIKYDMKKYYDLTAFLCRWY
jgi:hypothetical protein